MTTSISLAKRDDGKIEINGFELDAVRWRLGPGSDGGRPISLEEFFQHLGSSGQLRGLVVGVIGPREATPSQISAAEQIAYSLGQYGITLICGGKSGVMEAASRGCRNAGGMMIGILPGSTPSEANDFVSVPLPTGLGEARNMIIAKASRVLVAIGGSYGTLSEVAYGLHFSKPVIGLEGAAKIDGVNHVESADAAVRAVLNALVLASMGTEPTKNGDLRGSACV
ncbi:TIGR00725 family protein [Roseobacter sp. HKCCD9010]|uniref:TIGR00725 family protein n=1 Tax=unclassified Roseobacter TaxID=196798 RepID=UPI0014930095|nr:MULTISPECIES: TIGR00725 family protein [unclassified Roseobacter]MBF9052445.1 TIGR00725 family protein [Rhodobacterales bacterium HKCCD4356]NNV79139.1 TIGR00725 family protein [Roseobacter sp. HKCCD6135]NNY04847.1 TIGR00725 family protein [Roseobacter sp. HKCCD7635]NNZ02854.1 TIGR00725 family protein [Roseobacter sp. HKCCD5862]NNZ41208.1 TIGR00725 family protein [Roseobacter sp. HKCCD8806]NNZ66546.1 TIGR00725 family protein [Roseobacter sp. HKCCD5928]NOA34855.1 TIGR00725 family protein [R